MFLIARQILIFGMTAGSTIAVARWLDPGIVGEFSVFAPH
jgi:hypothetical protein